MEEIKEVEEREESSKHRENIVPQEDENKSLTWIMGHLNIGEEAQANLRSKKRSREGFEFSQVPENESRRRKPNFPCEDESLISEAVDDELRQKIYSNQLRIKA